MKCCEISIGKLRHKINLQRRVQTDDGYGGGMTSWVTFASVFAWIKPLTGGEKWAAMKVESFVTHKIIIRYRTDFSAIDRILHDGRAFNVRAAMDIDEKRRFIEIPAEEGVA